MAIYTLDGTSPELPEEGQYWIAPSASVIGRVKLGYHASVWFGAVLRGDIELIEVGDHSNIQDNCVIHTDKGLPVTIGSYCTIGHQAILHGCTIASNTLVGMGAVILNGARIGSNCLIGAHSLITENKVIPGNSLVMGVPGRVVRSLESDAAASIRRSAERYVSQWQRYATGLAAVTEGNRRPSNSPP